MKTLVFCIKCGRPLLSVEGELLIGARKVTLTCVTCGTDVVLTMNGEPNKINPTNSSSNNRWSLPKDQEKPKND